ncbi:DUF998 domain-containing protein [Gemella sp. GH3]|uniref:DUF998 domain-containing protein n=1 Tax=unclassified Gemella TaxID=2624949 RepID=UPI0015CFEFDA|nr:MULTISPECIES: DUF998 domain-containing protein [unclassified Gemella]MBF0714030.1 DUF998 domain-containing protein [Gemella sp. GH3.1]NYS50982.1 DUF998 domain-containing protein [Gemella sp. GH3]
MGAFGFLLNALIYLGSEFIAALGTNYPLGYVYGKQFISALGVYNGQVVEGVPENFSNWAIVMNIGFIITAFGFVVFYFLLIFPKMKERSKVLAYSLMMIVIVFGIGSMLVGLFQGGVPGEDGLHGIGARLSFIIGNSTLLLTGIFLPSRKIVYRTISVILGIIGFIAAGFLQSAITENQVNVMAIYERLTVYPITTWQIMSGLMFLKDKSE